RAAVDFILAALTPSRLAAMSNQRSSKSSRITSPLAFASVPTSPTSSASRPATLPACTHSLPRQSREIRRLLIIYAKQDLEHSRRYIGLGFIKSVICAYLFAL